MGTLYVAEMGVQVHKEGQRLLVKKGQEILQDIPLIKVDRVVLMGKGVNITTPTLFALANNNIGVFYLNSLGKYVLRTVGEEHHHSRLRQAQIRACDNQTRCMEVAQSIVCGKVHNQKVLVQRHSENSPLARAALTQMDEMMRQVGNSRSLDELRGREGFAAKNYFHLLRKIFRPPSDGPTWGFEQRTYYPPTDPINALLSFGYTLLLNDLVAACQITGLDPDIGFFHVIDYNKPAMALDLEEQFRPVIVDSIVLSAINRPIFNLHDFEVGKPFHKERENTSDTSSLHEARNNSNLALLEKKQGLPDKKINNNGPCPIYLTAAARKRFIDLYETRVNEQVTYSQNEEKTSYRRIFELQAYAMARMILGETDRYQPFVIR